MRIFRRLRHRRPCVPLSVLVERITARSQHPVWLRVRDRVRGMSQAEAAGYIRVRAATVVECEVGIAAAEEPAVAACHWPGILQSVRERVVQRALAEVARQQRRRPVARRVA